ncbi:hypothetical protein ACR79M_05055 [Sphingobacterium spiritivorum]|uniref:hypothetical protein n=1 Tax=Sphingobacterium spiritivorum TaxID=258 RepID=UPI003DA6A6CB
MKSKSELRHILKACTDDILIPLDFHEKLVPAITGLSQQLFDSVEINGDNESLREHYGTESGNAIGPLWAALCSKEVLRTQRFIKGLYQAIHTCLKERQTPVHILYAGTGPFATLAIPVMTQFLPEEIQFTLLEINPISFEKMQKCINHFGFESYVRAYHCCDASTWKAEDKQVDILISETMHNGLYREPQVSIMLNLLSQLPSDCICIPQQICVDLVVKENFSKATETISSLMSFDRKYIDQVLHMSSSPAWQFTNTTVQIPENPNLQFYLDTTIQVYEDQHLRLNDCSLNLLRKFNVPEVYRGQKIEIQYQVSQIPSFLIREDN